MVLVVVVLLLKLDDVGVIVVLGTPAIISPVGVLTGVLVGNACCLTFKYPDVEDVDDCCACCGIERDEDEVVDEDNDEGLESTTCCGTKTKLSVVVVVDVIAFDPIVGLESCFAISDIPAVETCVPTLSVDCVRFTLVVAAVVFVGAIESPDIGKPSILDA